MDAKRQPEVPLCDLTAQYRTIQTDLEAAVLKVLRSGQAILGPETAAFEKEFAAYCGTAYALGCGSGTDALSLALHALEIGPGDEVILPPFTFFATVGCVVRTGAKPVFADIDPVTYNIDPAQIENKITPRTRAIIPVHLYGQAVDMEPIWRIADRNGIAIIEDAAQAIGAEYQGKRTGTLGAIGCFSFYPSKNLGTFGDAGMVVTNDPDWHARMTRLRVHGMEPKYYHKVIGWNARIDALHAAILRVKLPYIEEWNAARLAAAKRYDALIDAFYLNQYFTRPAIQPRCKHVFHQYVVRVPAAHRDHLVKHLKAEGVGCEIYYPVPLHLQECLVHLGYRPGDFPASEEAARTVLAFPMFPELTEVQQVRVLEVCAAFIRKQNRLAA